MLIVSAVMVVVLAVLSAMVSNGRSSSSGSARAAAIAAVIIVHRSRGGVGVDFRLPQLPIQLLELSRVVVIIV